VLFYDLPHHLRPGGSVTGQTAEGSWLGLAHLIDVPNVVALLAPAFVLMLPVLARTGPPAWRDRAEQFRLALAIPSLVVLVLVFPQQGIFRDLDVFAPWTTALGAIAVGALAARLPAGRLRTRWLARAALVGGALGMALVVSYANPDTGLQRVRAYLVGPPLREPSTRSLGWDFLIGPYVRRERYDDAEACLREAIALAPHRRLFLTWGLIEVRLRRPTEVARAYDEMTRRWPDDAIAWYGLGPRATRSATRSVANRRSRAWRRWSRTGTSVSSWCVTARSSPRCGPRHPPGSTRSSRGAEPLRELARHEGWGSAGRQPRVAHTRTRCDGGETSPA
jgi:hypothetical protein